MRPPLSRRITGLAPSATLATDARARRLQAAGLDVISFATGEPDFPTPPHIVEAAAQSAGDTSNHKYSSAAGLPALRAAVVADSNALAPEARVSAENVMITNGAKQAIFSAAAAIIDRGDEVLLPAPYWTTYPETIRFFGGVTVAVPARRAEELPTVDMLESRRTDRTKALVWCSPANPSGAVADAALTRAVYDWAREHELWIISDEIYRKLYYGPGRIPTLRALGTNRYSRLIVIDGVSKAYSMTGWRVGWTIADEGVTRQMALLQGHLASNVNNMAQIAAAEALSGDQASVTTMLAAFRRRRDLAASALTAIRGMRLEQPEGAFYVFPDVEELMGELGFDSSRQLADWILDTARIAVVPGEAFGCPGHIRLSYALAEDRLVEGLERLRQALTYPR